jgi:hypothetical protein
MIEQPKAKTKLKSNFCISQQHLNSLDGITNQACECEFESLAELDAFAFAEKRVSDARDHWQCVPYVVQPDRYDQIVHFRVDKFTIEPVKGPKQGRHSL